VVGIGASAGGLEAFTELLHHLPSETGMAFVLVQHLDPTHESILTELLSKTTKLSVLEARNKMPLKPDHVYVIPPNTKMTMRRGILRLVTGKREVGAHHSIDHFLESLARDRGPQAVGVILSGSASDGTVGLEAIKNEGGITFAQDRSARYEGMPRSAITAGCVDFVLAPAQIASELGKIAEHPHLTTLEPGAAEALPRDASEYGKVLNALRMRTGVDFSLYKSTTIRRRITRRMALSKTGRLPAYLNYLRSRPSEVDALYQDILISVTGFFRNPEVFETLQQKVFTALIKERTSDQPVRVWVVGCSTGQEVYSLAMAFLEYAGGASTQVPVQVFGTDLNEVLLDKARAGLYSKSDVRDLSPERLRRFFVQEEGGYRICKPIRELCVFARHDVLSDPPFSRIDLLSCRNVLIYMEPALQKRLLPLFHYALRPEGFLLLGSSETIGGFEDLFAVQDKECRLYSKKGSGTQPEVKAHVKRGMARKAAAPSKGRNLTVELAGETDAQREADRVLLARYAPAGVLVNDELRVLQFRGRTGPYLELAPGRVSYDLAKMLREGLLLPVRATIQKARRTGQVARAEDVEFQSNGETQRTGVEVIPLKRLKERWFLVVFDGGIPPLAARQQMTARAEVEVAVAPNLQAAQREMTRLRGELAATRDYLQSVTEQYEAANEELQAANEEGQSSNEELQSINEELETTKEELQSTNEELTTVNEEMATRNNELHRINSDLHNVLNGVQMCIVVLGADLCIRRFTPLAKRMLNLLPTDVGRSITNIRPNFDFPDLEGTILKVIDEVRPGTREVQDKSGRWFSLRILPYKTIENKIDGAVLLLVDIDALKRSEQRIQAALDYVEGMIETVREPLLVLDTRLCIERANRSFFQTFRISPEETYGKLMTEIAKGQWNIPVLTRRLHEVLSRNAVFNDFEVEAEFERIGRRMMLLNGRPIPREGAPPEKILLAIEDVTERKELEVLRESEQRFRMLAEGLPHLVWTSKLDGNCDYFNSKWTEYTGLPMSELLGLGWRETIHEEDRERTHDLWCAALKGETRYDLEFRIRRDDGLYRWFKVRATPLRDKQGEIIKWFGTCTDIEDQKEAHRQIAESARELERQVAERTTELRAMLQELESFSYSVSHDLRSPLRAMIGFGTLALEQGDERLDAQTKDYLERIVTAANRADRLVRDVLSYSRVSRASFQLAPVDLDKLIREVISQNEQLQAPQAEIEWQPPLLKVIAHEPSLAQCIANLLSNAVKFVLPATTPRVKIWTEPVPAEPGPAGPSPDAGNRMVRIWFQDNGIGIDPANQGRIFGIFERVHSVDQYEGTGIGLAIVRKNIERMEGSVGVESEPGLGSRFWIQLKAAA
jgi:two-component system CheB/CheR fusion protein